MNSLNDLQHVTSVKYENLTCSSALSLAHLRVLSRSSFSSAATLPSARRSFSCICSLSMSSTALFVLYHKTIYQVYELTRVYRLYFCEALEWGLVYAFTAMNSTLIRTRDKKSLKPALCCMFQTSYCIWTKCSAISIKWLNVPHSSAPESSIFCFLPTKFLQPFSFSHLKESVYECNISQEWRSFGGLLFNNEFES